LLVVVASHLDHTRRSEVFFPECRVQEPQASPSIDAQANPPYTIQTIAWPWVRHIANRTLHQGDNLVSYTTGHHNPSKDLQLGQPSDRLHFQREAIDLLAAAYPSCSSSAWTFGGDKSMILSTRIHFDGIWTMTTSAHHGSTRNVGECMVLD